MEEGAYVEDIKLTTLSLVQPFFPLGGSGNTNPLRPWRGPRLLSQSKNAKATFPFHAGIEPSEAYVDGDKITLLKPDVVLDLATTQFRTPLLIAGVHLGISPVVLSKDTLPVQTSIPTMIGDEEDDN